MGKGIEQILLQDIEMANKHMKGCLTASAIRETHIKTTMRYHLPCARMAIFSKSKQTEQQKISSVGKDVEKLKPLSTAGGTVKWCSCCEK